MSSHHIVRDNQEPALLVLNADEISFETIEELLEWSPSIIVDESQIDLFLLHGIKIDAVLFEMKNQSEVIQKITDQLPVHLLGHHSEDKMMTFMNFLKDKNHRYVNIIASDDQLLSSLISSTQPEHISVFLNNIRWSLIRSGRFEKWMEPTSEIILFDGQERKNIYPNINNMITISQNKNFWIGEILD